MKKSVLSLTLALLTVALGSTVMNANDPAKDEQEIRGMYAQFPTAFRAKDVDAIMKVYAPGNELVLYDVGTPRQFVGFDAVRKDYQDFFAAFPGPVDKDDIQDLKIMTDGKLAYSRMVEPVTLTGKDGSKFSMTLRITDVLRKVNGKWLIVQEHISVPIDFDQGKPDFESKQ